MLETRKYNKIVEAKDFLNNLAEEQPEILYEYDIMIQLIHYIMARKLSILDKQAILTVCLSGVFVDGVGFMMPSTAACCENFRSVCRDLKKKRQLYLLIFDPTDQRSDTNGYFSVGIF